MSNIKITKRFINRIIVLISICSTLLFAYGNTIISRAIENFDSNLCVYANYLSSDDRVIYEQVYNAILDYNEELFYLEHPIPESSLETIMNALFNDHPELFWANTSYQYAVDAYDVVYKIKLKYAIRKADLSGAKANYETAISDITTGASKFSNDVEREKYIHDKICSMNTYNESNALNQSAYSALTTGSSVCAGYARAFQIVCNRSGIPCYYVTGESKGKTHAWNIVYVNGNYYNVDLTWDDCVSESTGVNSYTYFNRNDWAFNKDHVRSTQSAMLAGCY